MAERVSIIVVTADSGVSSRACVARALASCAPVEVIVVDNASRDGVPQALERAFAGDPRVRVIYNGANLGFGPAVNRAARQARGDALLILNPDCLLEPGTLPRLLAVLDAHPDAGIVGAVGCAADGTPDPASRRRDPLLARALNTLMRRAQREGINVAGPIPRATLDVENLSGALMLLPAAAFARLGGFDERYFLHCEDLDLCRRARDAGFRVLLAGDVRVLHAKGGSSRRRPVFVSYHKHRGMWRWFRKFDPAARRPLLRVLVAGGITAHFLAGVPRLWWRGVAARKA